MIFKKEPYGLVPMLLDWRHGLKALEQVLRGSRVGKPSPPGCLVCLCGAPVPHCHANSIHRAPSIQIVPTLGSKVYKYYLLWAFWSHRQNGGFEFWDEAGF